MCKASMGTPYTSDPGLQHLGWLALCARPPWGRLTRRIRVYSIWGGSPYVQGLHGDALHVGTGSTASGVARPTCKASMGTSYTSEPGLQHLGWLALRARPPWGRLTRRNRV